ncbi:LADA_0E13146g1_1 [Lachancea dasiensis]|uniref:Dolichyl-diphosphooligosaccharide--protein glycosyltransferase subunit WBP1 n=1 Tax=Lachancea dasiensis TaxID=1072105 RepID=A0A1G4JFF2_9SACH|nr:LADA_0E13146g1_1 [Lachancea dasiensis]
MEFRLSYVLKLLFAWIQVIAIAQAKSSSGSKTLIVYDQRVTALEEYSVVFNSLKDRSFDIHYTAIGNDSTPIELFDGESRDYDKLIIFPTRSRHFNRQLPANKLLAFLNNGGDVLAMTSPDGVADNVRVFLNQLGIYPSPKNFVLKDYMHATDDDNSLLLSSSSILNEHVVTKGNYELKYKGSAALLDNSELIIPVLQAPRTSFTEDSQKANEKWTVGTQGYAAVSFQSLYNSRVSWVGSDSFFSDRSSSPNSQFVDELMKWTFSEKSVLKSVGGSHVHLSGLDYADVPYKINDQVVYKIGLSEWNGEFWVPFMADDVQLELRMIDPYYRITLVPNTSTDCVQYYSSGEINLPDHHGIFTFSVNYMRSGLSFVSERDVKAIRHLANDEYPRSWEITNSWVYLTAIYSVIGAWSIFVVLFLGIQGRKDVTVEKKNN